MKGSSNKFIFISFLLLLFFKNSLAQQFFVKSYALKEGLPTRNINDACQDNDGIMWFATSYGISKYDGFRFTNYDLKDGLPYQFYRKVKIDARGILWAMPDNILDTIVFRDGNKWGKISPPPREERNYLMNSFDVLYKNNKPVICVGSFNGYFIWENNTWSHFSISPNPALNYVYSVVAKNQEFFLSTRVGICIVNGSKQDWSLTDLVKPFGTDIIAINFGDRNTKNEKLWVLTENWLGYIQQNTFRKVTDKFKLPHPSIFYYSYVNSDHNGNVFFGNIWAKYYISNKSDIPVPLMFDNGFSSHGATSVFIDREQNVWITDTRGINKINNLKVINYFRRNGMLEDEVTAIAETNDGKIVLGHNNGLSILSPNNTFKVIEFPDRKLNTRRVGDMMKDREGNIWFASISRGIGELKPDLNINWYSSDKYPVTNVVHQDRNGRIWVGADTVLLYIRNKELFQYPFYSIPSNVIRKIFSDDKDGIYVTGSNGLWHIVKDKVERVPAAEGHKTENVYSYYKSKSGVQYVGCNNGLYVIKNGLMEKFRYHDIEINTPVFFIFQDSDDNFWFGSNTGVYKWDTRDNLEVFNIYNGLAGWETNRAAGMSDSKGRVWIGTDRGLTCFEPGYNNAVISVPEIKLLYAEDSKGIRYPLNRENSLKNASNTLVFHFRGISFINEDLIEYKYKLEGFDQDWQQISQPMLDNVKYIGLKPGKYTLCVMAKNFSGAWSQVARSETITIKPPFYLTWWFLLLSLIAASLIIFGIIRYRVQRLHNAGLQNEIAERKLVEQDLIESKQRYHDLVELLPETIYEADFSGKIIYLNDTGFRLFGYMPQDLNTYLLLDQLAAPESRDDMHLHIEAVHEYKRADRALMTGITKSGNTFPISIHTVPVVVNKKCIGTRGIIIDMTEQKRFEDQLQKNAEDLQAINNSKDKFFSIIAHDLRSPFTSFLGFTEILDEEFDTLPEKELRSIISLMRGSALNLYQLLENLLEWSMLHREITQFEPRNTTLLPLIESCLEVITHSAQLKDIEVSVDVPADLEVVADIHMLMTIVRNLLTNAVKFTHREGKVHISAIPSGEHFVTIAVKDTGIGIAADLIQKIFRIDTNNKTKGTEGEVSTGLGLILCKEFVEKHGGNIWVESEEGKGSTFYFTLKIAG
ncbi:MAG TPA: ATP-binding protein [Bacteroidales bacterium]|nr:ATP-binding protein [Bacteroidales bacterium]